MASLPWQLYTERMVGRNHPSLTDTNNRALRQLLTESGYNPDADPFPGLMGPVFNVKARGAILDGVTDDITAVHAAIDAANAAGGGIVTAPPGKQMYVSKEIQLRADNTVLSLDGVRVLGPVAGTPEGALCSIVDRTNLARVVVNAEIRGGLWTPRNVNDNGVAAVSAHRSRICGATINLATGKRGVVLQTDSTFTGGSGTPLRDITISDCSTYGGGTNGLNIEAAGLTEAIIGVTVDNFIINGATTGARLSSGGNAEWLSSLNLRGLTMIGVAQALTANNIRRSAFSDIIAHALTTGGLDLTDLEDCILHGIRLASSGSPANPGLGIDDVTAAVAAGRCVLSDFALIGEWGTAAIYAASTGWMIGKGLIQGATTGINTFGTGRRNTYHDIQFDGVTTPVSAYRADDAYFNLTQRSGTSVIPLRNDAIATVIATASLPAAATAQDGRILIEDVAAGDRNLIVYAGGQRFRIDGGAAF